MLLENVVQITALAILLNLSLRRIPAIFQILPHFETSETLFLWVLHLPSFVHNARTCILFLVLTTKLLLLLAAIILIGWLRLLLPVRLKIN